MRPSTEWSGLQPWPNSSMPCKWVATLRKSDLSHEVAADGGEGKGSREGWLALPGLRCGAPCRARPPCGLDGQHTGKTQDAAPRSYSRPNGQVPRDYSTATVAVPSSAAVQAPMLPPPPACCLLLNNPSWEIEPPVFLAPATGSPCQFSLAQSTTTNTKAVAAFIKDVRRLNRFLP